MATYDSHRKAVQALEAAGFRLMRMAQACRLYENAHGQVASLSSIAPYETVVYDLNKPAEARAMYLACTMPLQGAMRAVRKA